MVIIFPLPKECLFELPVRVRVRLRLRLRFRLRVRVNPNPGSGNKWKFLLALPGGSGNKACLIIFTMLLARNCAFWTLGKYV